MTGVSLYQNTQISYAAKLLAPQKLEITQVQREIIPQDFTVLKIEACGICSSDYKMWEYAQLKQPSLKLPRVLGHECVGIDQETQKRYVVWPGIACQQCTFCQKGKPHLCSHLKIMGFDYDGGFATQVIVPKTSLVALPHEFSLPTLSLDSIILFTLSEPLACIISAFNKISINKEQHVGIVGAGTLGILGALFLAQQGIPYTLYEISPQKADYITSLWPNLNITTHQNHLQDLDIAINTASTEEAFLTMLSSLKKQGIALFFSGITMQQKSLHDINTVHYKELNLLGSYGCTPHSLQEAVTFLSQPQHQKLCRPLISQTLPLDALQHFFSNKDKLINFNNHFRAVVVIKPQP